MTTFFQDEYIPIFSRIVSLLKSRNALSEDAFTETVPFFNTDAVSHEAQIRELFQSKEHLSHYQIVLQDVIAQLQAAGLTIPSTPAPSSHSHSHSMTFAQIILYKVLPCTDVTCRKYPREVVTHNQYKDSEYECPFYHHDKDQRRFVIGTELKEDFEYKASYFDERRPNGNREAYSQNYFESMFHPLYYKMFSCKRSQCSAQEFCPFFHSEQDKHTWDSHFSSFMGKDRVSYVKDKQKYYNSSNSNSNSNSSGFGSSRNESQKSTSPDDLSTGSSTDMQERRKIHSSFSWAAKKGTDFMSNKWKKDKVGRFNTWEHTKN